MPYSQMKTALPPLEVASTERVRIHLSDGRTLIDGVASWWTACHGYNHPAIVKAIQDQASQMPHIMMGGLIHEPARELSDSLSKLLPGEHNKVFLVDSGSVAVEVAMKMAVQFWKNQTSNPIEKNRFLCFQNSYHGDTSGAMSLCDPEDSMHAHFKGFLLEQFPHTLPETEFALVQFKNYLKQHEHQLAGVIVEPRAQMAAGMRFHSAHTLRAVFEACREHDVLFIADEVATGFGRTGSMFAIESAEVEPDIVCVGKGLTGCSVGLAATIATKKIYNAFHSDDPQHALMHGPTFMGNPIACAAANASIKLFETEPRLDQVAAIETQLRERLTPLVSADAVDSVHCLGAIGAVRMQHEVDVAQAVRFFVDRGVWIRPIRDTVYLAPAFTIDQDELNTLCDAISDFAHER